MKIINLVEDTQGSSHCEYEHGLSFYIETDKHKILMDTGASDLLVSNANKLDIDLSVVDTIILSHGHYDHSGGIIPFTKINNTAAIYMNEKAGQDYYNLYGNVEKYIGIDKQILSLSQCHYVNRDIWIDEEIFIFGNVDGTRNIPDGNKILKHKVNNEYLQDTFDHEQYLVIKNNGKSILLSGCAHKGILNILGKYRQIFNSNPDIVISGFHMIKKDGYSPEDINNIEETAVELLKTNAIFYTGHCTGEFAYNIMKSIMGDKLNYTHCGEVIC